MLMILRWYPIDQIPSFLWTSLMMTIAFSLLLWILGYRSSPFLLGIASCVFLGIICAVWISIIHAHHETDQSIEHFSGEKNITVAGIVVEQPDLRPTNARYVVEVQMIMHADGSHEYANGRVLVTDFNNEPALSYGDAVLAKGTLERPGVIEEFDYGRYLSVQDIYSVMNRAHVTLVKSHQGNSVMDSLSRTKRWFEGCINRLFPEPHASLMVGLLTGSRGMLSQNLTDTFKATGLTHIIAISGFNITIILTILSRILFWIPRRLRLIPLIIGITLFTLFVGASASVVRAAIMGILGLIALETGRQAQSRLLILWTAFFMTAWNPLLLWFDASFQLSFLAIIGITEVTPKLEGWMQFIPDTFAIRTSLAATLGAQISTFPLTTFLFHRIVLVAPLTNLFIAPLIPIAMLFGFLGTLVSVVIFPLGQLIGIIAFLSLDLILKIATIGAMIPYGSFEV